MWMNSTQKILDEFVDRITKWSRIFCCALLLLLYIAAQALISSNMTIYTDPPNTGAGYFSGKVGNCKFTLMPYVEYRTHGAKHPPRSSITLSVAGEKATCVSATLQFKDDPTTAFNEAPRRSGRDLIWTYRPQYAWNITRWRGKLRIVASVHGHIIPGTHAASFKILKRKQIILVARKWIAAPREDIAQAQLRWCCNFVAEVYRQVGLPLPTDDDVTQQFHEASVPDNGDGCLIFYELKRFQMTREKPYLQPYAVSHVAIKDGSHRININGYPYNGRYLTSIEPVFQGLRSYYAQIVTFRSTVKLDSDAVSLT